MSGTLPPLPLVPYCVSLTLTIFLRTYPQVDLQYGYTWMDSAKLLESMSDRWWVAAAMGKMGQSVFKRLEREGQEESLMQSNHNKEQQSERSENGDANVVKKDELSYNGSVSHEQPVQQSVQQQQTIAPLQQQQQQQPQQQLQQQQQLPSQPLQQQNELPPPPPATFEPFEYPYIEDSSSTATPTTVTTAGNTDQFLDMFSQLPNPTSFLDQAIGTDLYEDVKQWFEA
ncbi:uncharacterized protein SAPINGB_P002573 [Magnusiomyces paraingens]|uniref:Uncharacterized protein n=1 Tax=Magnusiomyces paraingens TaxID=2606893 RepID=A0A5E8BEM0_9ASCO|nr:uncharacterized protein SAPINGB_P002573 [Saprochaete ingens]VVT50045.1 unnamed protein product [Saprochaete ingens]